MKTGSFNSQKTNGEPGSGNVFADVGLPNPELAQTKAELVRRIRNRIERKKLTQVQAAKILFIDQPKISALLRGRTDGYSLDRLFRFLTLLGQRVEIRIRDTTPKESLAGIHVVSA